MSLKGNNAQIVGKMLLHLSTQKFDPDTISDATEMLRAMIMLRGGGEFGYKTALEFEWGSESEDDETGEIFRQGIRTVRGQYFLSDMFVQILEDPIVSKRIVGMFPDVDDVLVEALLHLVYRIFNSHEYFESDLPMRAENLDAVDIKRWKIGYMKAFREMEELYLGVTKDTKGTS